MLVSKVLAYKQLNEVDVPDIALSFPTVYNVFLLTKRMMSLLYINIPLNNKKFSKDGERTMIPKRVDISYWS